jgi:phosphate starvation-inducible PhoH-like protein
MSRNAARYQQDNGGRGKPNGKGKARAGRDPHKEKVERGEAMIAEDRANKFSQEYNLGWFHPRGNQQRIVDSFYDNVFTVVKGTSGTGKTATAVWLALKSLRDRDVRQVVYIKTPVESAVAGDTLGFLKGDLESKLSAFMEPLKVLLEDFLPKAKIQADTESKKIWLTVPNFAQGISFKDVVVIVDEAQNLTPAILKLLLERCGENCRYIVMGDPKQCYAAKKRENGFDDLIRRVTYENYGALFSRFNGMFGYVEMTPEDNQRSPASKLITEIYDDI